MKELINRTKINIVDGLRGEGFANAADNIDKLDLSKVKNLNDLAYKITDMAVAPKDLSNLTTKEAFALKQKISNATKFNGTPSDDKAVNATLKEIYGSLKDKLNKGVSANNPEVTSLNEKYADLTSAVLATKNRDAIVQRSALASMPVKVGTIAGIVTAMATGVGVAPVLTAIGAGMLDKALGTTAVKSRVAAWLGSETPNVIQKILAQNPEIVPILRRVFPNVASKLGKDSTTE